MKRRSQLVLFLVGAIVAVGIVVVRAIPRPSIQAASPAHAEPALRAPAVAGTFYPAIPTKLRADVQRYLSQADVRASRAELVGLIVPHAGYVYSAPVAGYAYRALEGRSYETVVVIGPSHRVACRGVALSGMDQWVTPLGRVTVDRAACDAVAKTYPAARIFDAAHRPEHSIEVQLPFLQTTLDDFKLVPLLMADSSAENCNALAQALAEWARGRSALLIASTDMSHYPAYEDAVRVDHETLKAIETCDARQVATTTEKLMSEGVPRLGTCLCGEGPVRTVLTAARLLGADRVEVLRYANSGDVPLGPREGVVGYCAVAIYRSKSVPGGRVTEVELKPEQQRRLLSVARETIEQYVQSGRVLRVADADPALRRPAAAFVTLKKGSVLRGCIGSLEPDKALVETVRDRAIHAASRDPRFSAVRAEELPELEIEISVLSPVRRVRSAEEIDISKHGIIVASGTRRGVFLPQVAQETGWSRDVLLAHLCRDKAGLPADAWKRGASLSVFTVQAFSSPAPGEKSHAGD